MILVSLGGWIRGTQVVSGVVAKNYDERLGQVLRQPELLRFIRSKINQISPDLHNDPLVKSVNDQLGAIEQIVATPFGQSLSAAEVTQAERQRQQSDAGNSTEGLMMRRRACLCLTILLRSRPLCAGAGGDRRGSRGAPGGSGAGRRLFQRRLQAPRRTLGPAPSRRTKARLIAVNLYAGNEYWFSVGATEKAKKLTVEVFDETGAPVVAEIFNSGTKAAAGFSVSNSGQYFVRLRLEEGEAAGVCFLYSYK